MSLSRYNYDMRNNNKSRRMQEQIERVLHPEVLKELTHEVRRELEASHPPFSLTPEDRERIVALMAWVASEAYVRGFRRLAPPDF
jgi:hypothetical protein